MKTSIREVANDPGKIRVVNKKIVTDKTDSNKNRAKALRKKISKVIIHPEMSQNHGAFNIRI